MFYQYQITDHNGFEITDWLNPDDGYSHAVLLEQPGDPHVILTPHGGTYHVRIVHPTNGQQDIGTITPGAKWDIHVTNQKGFQQHRPGYQSTYTIQSRPNPGIEWTNGPPTVNQS